MLKRSLFELLDGSHTTLDPGFGLLPYGKVDSDCVVESFNRSQHPTFSLSDSEEPESEENQSCQKNKDLEMKEELKEINTTSTSFLHHFPRARYRFSQHPSSLDQDLDNRLRYGVVNCLEQGYDDTTLSEISKSSPLQTSNSTDLAVVTVVSPSEHHHLNSAVTSSSGPRVLIGNPVYQPVTPKPQHISTWPRKHNILNLIHNRRSLDVCISLNDRKRTIEEVAVSKIESEPQSSNLALDNLSLPDLETGGFFAMLIAVLRSRREECRRPEDLEQMTTSELAQEKLDLQKCLLYFESAKGRPMDSATKRIMKPLYDRYRCVRRMVRLSSNSAVRLSRSRSNGSAARPSIDLVEVPPKKESTPSHPAQCLPEVVDLPPEQHMIILESSPLLVTSSTNYSHSEATERTNSIMGNPPSDSFFLNWDLSLLEFAKTAKAVGPEDLTRGKGEILLVKHKLQRFLYDFEKRIQESTNRPPSKQDRDGFRSEYNRYRDCKQRLYVIDRFLEKPQTSPESLIVDTQAVGRAHRRRHAVGESATGGEMLQRKVSTMTKNSSADAAIA
ncbi:unnamed protein product [Rodentolepis nana]|uniref:FAM13A-like domain-containing protein n=1 Tax=Rodentolepis nana TaxID=102285 RepID=A0A0R3U003_RODNA|nr:unnamed protein product [Rodentolepis nana]